MAQKKITTCLVFFAESHCLREMRPAKDAADGPRKMNALLRGRIHNPLGAELINLDPGAGNLLRVAGRGMSNRRTV